MSRNKPQPKAASPSLLLHKGRGIAGELTFLTVAPCEARTAPPLQRGHSSVGHFVRGPDESPVTNTNKESAECSDLLQDSVATNP